MRTFLSFFLALILFLCFHPHVHALEGDSFGEQSGGTFSDPPISQEPPTQHLPTPAKLNATAIRVFDGATIEVILPGGRRETVRFLQIGVPADRYCGPQAADLVKRMILGKTVQLELGHPERDQEGRLLAYVYANGKSVQQALLNEGLAKVNAHPSNGKYLNQYRAFEDHAKALEKGIWAPAYCQKEEPTNRSDEKKGPPEHDNNPNNTAEQPKSGNNGGRLPKTGTEYPTQALIGAGILLLGLWIRRQTAE